MSNSQNRVKKILAEYIKTHNLRNTSERFTILEEIYSDKFGHFNVESLYNHLKTKNFSVTKTTLYNSLEIFIEAGLVVKHLFGNNISIYEKIFERTQHDHLICTKCGTISEFCDPRLLDIQNTVKDAYKFDIEYHSLYFYGVCNDCRKKDS